MSENDGNSNGMSSKGSFKELAYYILDKLSASEKNDEAFRQELQQHKHDVQDKFTRIEIKLTEMITKYDTYRKSNNYKNIAYIIAAIIAAIIAYLK